MVSRALSAAVAPSELKSSWPALVGRLAVPAGLASTWFSATSAAATYCSTIRPEHVPGRVVRNCGSGLSLPVVREQTVGAPLAERGHLRGEQRQRVERQRERLAVEVAAGEHDRVVREAERVVGDRVELGCDRLRDVVERLPAGAENLRDAARAVGVLHAPTVGVARVELRARDEGADARSHLPLARAAAERVDAVVHRCDRAEQNVEAERGRELAALEEPLGVVDEQRAGSRHQMGPVDEREPFLARKLQRVEPRQRQARVGIEDDAVPFEPALADDAEREVRERSEVAARSDGAARGDDGRDLRVQEGHDPVDELGPDAGVALGEAVAEQQHHRADRVGRQRLADGGGVAADEVLLELGEVVV